MLGTEPQVNLYNINQYLPCQLSCYFYYSGLFIPYQHLTPIARDAGIAHSKAAFLISVIGNT